MKNNLKHIAVAVIVVMACLFTYQSWWLVRMYSSEVTKTENAVRTALRTCDFSEMMARLQRVRDEKSGIGFAGDITVGAGYGSGGTLVSQININAHNAAKPKTDKEPKCCHINSFREKIGALPKR